MESNMEHLTKAQIANIVRREIHIQTGKSIKSMHPDTRIYGKDAKGVYPKNYSGKNLGLNAGSMDRVLLELETELKIDLELPGEWANPKSFDGTPIEYNKNTRLHDFIDFVYDAYNKMVQEKKKDKPDQAATQAIDNDTKISMFDSNGEISFYYVRVIKDNVTLYVAEIGPDVFQWTSNKGDMCFFDLKYISDNFDLLQEDVILSAKQCSLSNFLSQIVPPFEISFVQVKEYAEDNNWTYSEDDRIAQILTKLSPEEAELIKARLK